MDRNTALTALCNMRQFYLEVSRLYSSWGLDLSEDLGRRNVMLSSAQEKFFAAALRAGGLEVIDDGRTGQSDITISISGVKRELECKLTTRNSSGSIVLQTDYPTLKRKGSLDYLYVVADDLFERFAVLHFEGLTIENFRVPSSGSRGKASMLKHTCHDHCRALVGDYRLINEKRIREIESCLSSDGLTPKKRRRLEERLEFWHNDPGRFEIELCAIE
jgi:hypothetical protein